MAHGTHAPVILWFRRDLRLSDHAALVACLRTRRPIVPAYILDDTDRDPWASGAAQRWWLPRSLAALDDSLRRRGSRLILRRGRWSEALPALVRETGASEVHAGRLYDPAARSEDTRVAERLKVQIHGHRTGLLAEPWATRTKQGGSFAIFTPFARASLAAGNPAPPIEPPSHLPAPAEWPATDDLDAWQAGPARSGSPGFEEEWTPGEGGAHRRLGAFLDRTLDYYATQRERLDRRSTSRLSPHLYWGEISAATVWHAAAIASGNRGGGLEDFHRNLLWREFSNHLLWHHPAMTDAPLRPAFARFPWRQDEADLRAWQDGRTGYPFVDAAMRQLRHSGWIHNRARMVVASFLTKHLLLPWQDGARWFSEMLMDADPANNLASWQWVAGCGTDAAPYFRIFNPVRQGEHFDPEGAYVRTHLPELARLPTEVIHHPWEATPAQLAEAGVRLGETYPERIVDHAAARVRALDAFAAIGKAEE